MKAKTDGVELDDDRYVTKSQRGSTERRVMTLNTREAEIQKKRKPFAIGLFNAND